MPSKTQRLAPRRIAIVGGGLSGALLLLRLLRQGAADEIVVYEPELEIGPGLAYGAAAPWHLLNVVASRASLFEEDPDHWWHWAREHGPALGWPEMAQTAAADAYLPRRLYGHYIVAQLEQACRQSADVTVVHHRSPAAAIERHAAGFAVTDGEGRTIDCESVVLATGAPAISHLDVPGLKDLRTAGEWIDDPWDLQRLGEIKADHAVLIVGSALTMADAILSLQQQGHIGQIHVLSRHGIVPAPRHEQVALPTGISSDDAALPMSWLLHRLRRAVQIHGHDNWQGVFEGLRGCTNDLWCSLPAPVQKRFMRHLKAQWDAHRFRMPPSTAAVLHDLQAQQRLQFHKGRLHDIHVQPDYVRARYRPRGSRQVSHLWVHSVIDCTGPRRPSEDWAGQLQDRLTEQGLLCSAACGIGIHASREGAVLDRQDAVVPGLFVLGPPLRGTLLESTAISEIRGQAGQLAKRLASRDAAGASSAIAKG